MEVNENRLSGLPFPPPGDLPDPGIKLASPALPGGFFATEPPDTRFGHKFCRGMQDFSHFNPFHLPQTTSTVYKTLP